LPTGMLPDLESRYFYNRIDIEHPNRVEDQMKVIAPEADQLLVSGLKGVNAVFKFHLWKKYEISIFTNCQ